MTVSQATAEVFMTAFRALPRQEQDSFLMAVIRDNRFREDIIDLAIAAKRCCEKTKPLRAFLKSLRKPSGK
jgi:hypothetical protein